MKKLLAFSFHPAFVPPRSGGELRLFHVYRELSRHYRVVLLSSTFHGVPEERVVHGAGFHERRIPKCDRFLAEWQRLEAYASGGDMSGVSVASSGQLATPMHLAYLEEYADADIVIHDSPFTVLYDLFLGLDSKPRIYNSYNCESALMRQLHPQPRSQPLHDIVDGCERQLLRHADLVAYCAEPDLAAFKALADGPLRCTIEVANGLVPPPAAPRPDAGSGRARAVFIGSAHLPNVDAARFVADELALELPEVDFDVIGGCLPPGTYAPNVFRHGQTDASDKERIIRAAAVGLNPMGTGSGSNLKVLDFFGAGLPVVSTAFGVRGYDVEAGRDCLIAERPAFASTLAALLNDPDRMQRMGRQGKRSVESRYAWSQIVARFHTAIEGLRPQTGRLMDRPFVLGMNDYEPFAAAGGGAVRIQGLVAALDRQQPVFYLCFADDDRVSVRRHGTQSVVLQIPRTAEHQAEVAATNAMFWVSVADIVAIDMAPRNPMLRAAYAVLRAKAASIAMDHPYMVGLPRAYSDAFIYSSQNYESLLKRGLLAQHPAREHYLAVLEDAEDHALVASTLVVAVCEEDAHAFNAGRPAGAPMAIVRNGAPAPATVEPQDAEVAAQRVGPRAAVFIGSAHMPNVQACQFIVKILAAAMPDASFHLLGAAALSLPLPVPDNVVIWGSVSDSLKSAVLERCAIAINPMFSGGGSNIKLADYLGHGLHVLASPFGRRGYPDAVDAHVSVADAAAMPGALRALLDDPALNGDAQRLARRTLFADQLSMAGLAESYARLVVASQKPMLRVLFVTYRWVWPTRGGAEAHLLQHLAALSASGRFSVDVVAPDVGAIVDVDRFTSRTEPAGDASAPVGMPHLRYRRFPTKPWPEARRWRSARAAWEQTAAFERAMYLSTTPVDTLRTGLAWGWSGVEGQSPHLGRWTYTSFGIHLAAGATLRLRGTSMQAGALLVTDSSARQLLHMPLSEGFSMTLAAPPGEVRFEVSAVGRIGNDIRPLGIYVNGISVDDQPLDLAEPVLAAVPDADPRAGFERLHAAALSSRGEHGVELTPGRGPHAPSLERFIDDNVASYDLVLTHNTVFRTTSFAVQAARQASVPVAVLPHAHLDDDYYHFPDVTRAAVDADLVLAAPQAACDFYRRRGARKVVHMTPGCDASETFTAADESAFRSLWPLDLPFVLVLGRKAGAKGYASVITAVQGIAQRLPLAVVLIGPDEDGVAVTSPAAHYLGPQRRNVLRGALRACTALVNMSTSESFGMVLLEAWLAGKPVIVNRHCAAFADLAEHGVNALTVDESDLAASIEALMRRPAFARELGANGRTTALRYDQPAVDERFVKACLSLCEPALSNPNPIHTRTRR